MNMQSIRWSEVVPWTLLGVVLSCGGASIAPVASPAGGTGTFTSIDTQEIVLRGKDGQVRGTLTGERLSLSDAAGNRIEIALDAAARVELTNAQGSFVVLAVSNDGSDMVVSAGGRKIVAGVETERPLADLEIFDADDKRRASFGLNSNGEPRLSLYDAKETRRLYGILTDDGPMLDFNDSAGVSALQLFGADATRGSGMSVTQSAKTSSVGLAVDGKPLR